ncbi:predicted protein [Sclerotinia sclerotiorum 1980 UF-70]|uniref:Uncharacterized protein n=1 Tax=Sclerotinia sclerotiorum (strain ATCC 18683 / 1980 / Ss-1) TaxID=665079 RepID=A7EG33_SCLS1|nr:predicted protein [Sclerotinia sclerotiorum 1980 UF-70]EDO01799.1 predicted protein [Sclerotinia sclerotiorum 1980 UF-70]
MYQSLHVHFLGALIIDFATKCHHQRQYGWTSPASHGDSTKKKYCLSGILNENPITCHGALRSHLVSTIAYSKAY